MRVFALRATLGQLRSRLQLLQSNRFPSGPGKWHNIVFQSIIHVVHDRAYAGSTADSRDAIWYCTLSAQSAGYDVLDVYRDREFLSRVRGTRKKMKTTPDSPLPGKQYEQYVRIKPNRCRRSSVSNTRQHLFWVSSWFVCFFVYPFLSIVGLGNRSVVRVQYPGFEAGRANKILSQRIFAHMARATLEVAHRYLAEMVSE